MFTRLLSFAFSAVILNGAAVYSVSPSTLEKGKSFTLLVMETPCANPSPLAKAKVRTASSSLKINSFNPAACNVTLNVETPKDTPFGPVHLEVLDENDKLLAVLTVEVTGLNPEPTPPGLPKQVDIFWKVLPYRQTADSYGRKVATQTFAIEISLGNNTGYPILIENIGFLSVARKHDAPIPNDAYAITRSTIEREQQVGRRAIVLNSIAAVSSLAAAFGGFIPDTLKSGPNPTKADYGVALGLFNPITDGFNLIWPDKTTRHLVALDTRSFRGSLIIPNNQQKSIYTFIAREMVECSPNDKGCDAGRIDHKKKAFDPNLIAEKLGSIVIVGNTIEYLARVRVSREAVTPPATPPIVFELPESERTIVQGTTKSLTIPGTGLLATKAVIPSDSRGVTAGPATPDETFGKWISLDITATGNAQPGERTLAISNSAGQVFVRLLVKASKPTVAATNGVSPAEIVKGTETTVTITGTNLLGATLAVPAGWTKKDETATATTLSAKLTAPGTAALGDATLTIDHFGEKTTAVIKVVKAAASTITSASPNEITKGVATEVTFTGTNLRGAKVTVPTGWTKVDGATTDTTLKATLTPPSTATAGDVTLTIDHHGETTSTTIKVK